MNSSWLQALREGLVIPACPLALKADRTWDEKGQWRLLEYYGSAGAGGVAVGVHTTQFAIRDSRHGLFEPLLQLAGEAMADMARRHGTPLVRVGGICGDTAQALHEAETLRRLDYHAGLLSLGALHDADEATLLAHCRNVAAVLPVFGFYLQPSVGGRVLSYRFWRQFAEIENVAAIKVAAFDRYRTTDVLRAVAESGREDIALYTGNDDNIIPDLLTPYVFPVGDRLVERRFVGGLLGQWAVGTRRAVEILSRCHAARSNPSDVPELLRWHGQLTDLNAALFDVAHHFAGCIPGIHEVLRRQGLLASACCLDPMETLSPGQSEEIDRVLRQYPHLLD